MKALLMGFVMATFLYAQNCEVKSYHTLGMMYPATEINLFDNYTLDLSKMPMVEPALENFNKGNTEYWAYLSQADSSIMVFVLEDGLKFFKICTSQFDCDQKSNDFLIRNIIIEEFNRLQAAGVFMGTAQEADSLIHHIVDKIENAPFSATVYDAKSYNLRRKNEDKAEMIAPKSSFCSNLGGKYEGQLCGVIDSVRQCILAPETSQVLRKSFIRNVSYGKLYYIFDLNGNVIYSGIWQDKTPRYHFPTIIKFAK